jgi:hypothetical protein
VDPSAPLQYQFASSALIQPLGVFGMRGPSGASDQAHEGGVRVKYLRLYQALPTQLASRTFAALRLRLIPGLAKYRDATGLWIQSVSENSLQTSAAVAFTRSIMDGDGAASSDDDVLGLPQAVRPGLPAAAASSPAPLLEFSSAPPPTLSRAVATLIELLLSPLVPQSRRAMLSGWCTGWRLSLPPVAQPARGVAVTPENPAAEADKMVAESLAERCAAVYLAARRSDETAS